MSTGSPLYSTPASETAGSDESGCQPAVSSSILGQSGALVTGAHVGQPVGFSSIFALDHSVVP
jgi:hypothetical protein